MSDHRGGCHCGAVRFVATLPDPPVPALECNCSICSMTGFIHLIVPHADFTLEAGSEHLTSYRFGTGAAEHLFCATCGIKSFYQPRSHPDAWSIHAYCLDDRPDLVVDLFEGRDWERSKAALDGSGPAG